MTECCTPFLRTTIHEKEAAELSETFRALADTARLTLLSLIADRGEVCGCELVEPVGLSQPTVSHHLKVLHEAGLLERERRGRWIHYRVRADRLEELREVLAPRQAVSV